MIWFWYWIVEYSHDSPDTCIFLFCVPSQNSAHAVCFGIAFVQYGEDVSVIRLGGSSVEWQDLSCQLLCHEETEHSFVWSRHHNLIFCIVTLYLTTHFSSL
jgi:hypothetical protein